jgi:hypothetical protein
MQQRGEVPGGGGFRGRRSEGHHLDSRGSFWAGLAEVCDGATLVASGVDKRSWVLF